MQQLDMFAAFAPPIVAARPARLMGRPIANHRPDDPNDHRRWVACDAWEGAVMVCGKDDPDPITVEVRGIPTVINFGFGFGTIAVNAPGTPYWSETGYRSFTGAYGAGPEDAAEIIRLIENYIDAPAKNGNGRAGKLTPWYPWPVLQLRQSRDFLSRTNLREADRAEDRELADKVRALGFDPDAVAPWPCRRRAARRA